MHSAASLTLALILSPLAAVAQPAAGDDAAFIRVAPDGWSFQHDPGGEPFIPFGTNFVLTDKGRLNMFGPDQYDRELYSKALSGIAALGFNLVKVFLPISAVLPDPQEPGKAAITPGYLERLDEFIAMARALHVRVELTLCCWGGNGVRWWHEGGQYFGRSPWKTDPGHDSLATLTDFWTQLCTRYRDNPTVFSYTPAVEWSFPAGNLTWSPPDKPWGVLDTEPGRWYWRAFLRARYEDDLGALNAAWGTHHASFDDVPLVSFDYDFATHKYADPDAMLMDYQNFREWASMRYFRPQIEAMRAADPNHMVTISNHMRRPVGLWEGAAIHFIGFSEPEQAGLVDYLTTHDNHAHSELRPGQTVLDVVRGSVLRARFCNAGNRKPLIIEELTYAAEDPQLCAEYQAAMVLGTVGSVSGWMNWYLQYPSEPNEADTPGSERSAILNADFTPTAWGLRARDLIARLRTMNLARTEPGTILRPDRLTEMVPHGLGTEITVVSNWNDYTQPVDFEWPPNEWINMPLIEER